MSTEIAVRFEGVTKRYGPVTALDGAGFRLLRGETRCKRSTSTRPASSTSHACSNGP